jgi:hypothetical protein
MIFHKVWSKAFTVENRNMSLFFRNSDVDLWGKEGLPGQEIQYQDLTRIVVWSYLIWYDQTKNRAKNRCLWNLTLRSYTVLAKIIRTNIFVFCSSCFHLFLRNLNLSIGPLICIQTCSIRICTLKLDKVIYFHWKTGLTNIDGFFWCLNL